MRSAPGDRARLARAAACGLVLARLAGASVALATFTSTTAAVSHSVSTATLAAPTGLTASRGSCTPVTGPVSVNLSWTATTSTWADGYQVFRSTTSGSGYTSVGTVSGRTTTSFTDSTVGFLTTYYYVVQATKNSWRSANSNEASVTTPSVLCL